MNRINYQKELDRVLYLDPDILVINSLQPLRQAVLERPIGCEAVLTGRDPAPWMCRAADYSTEMRCHRHPYEKGIAARKGVEF